jgi:broad specificity phosphatase PhoE
MRSARAEKPHAGGVRLYFIRHGETQWSLTGQHTGDTDLPLTPRGEEQASEVGSLLRGTQFSHVFTSPMRRARKTCELSELQVSVVVDPDLSEWDYGDYEGKKTLDIRHDHPGWDVFRDGCPSGESPEQIASRADRLVLRLRSLRGNVALYSHGQFGAVLAAVWIGLPVVHGRNFALDAASLSILGYSPTHPEVPVIALWNETTATILNRSRKKSAP